MSQQGPIIIVSTAQRPSFASALDDAKIFPIIDTGWADASRAIEQLQPAAVLVAMSDAVKADLETLAKRIAARQPYLPLLAIDPSIRLPENAIPFSQASGNFDRLVARLRAALRIRSLHATVMRRLDDPSARKTLPDIDPARDATVLLIGRGTAYPSLSVSLGERMGVVGALSIEAAAKLCRRYSLQGHDDRQVAKARIFRQHREEGIHHARAKTFAEHDAVDVARMICQILKSYRVTPHALPPTRCR